MSEIYDRLMADMKTAMKEHDMVAVNAIRGVIAKAEKLGGEGKVIEKEGWPDEPDETLKTGDVSVKKPNGGVKKLGGKIAHEANAFNCTSIFVRDGLNKIFS